MGAWGTEVLTNDTALDLMFDLSKSSCIKKTTYNLLTEAEYLEERLLAVELVDISINGVDESILGGLYDYNDWFQKLTENPMESLREEALKALEHVKANDNGWFPAYQRERKVILQKIEERLSKKKE